MCAFVCVCLQCLSIILIKKFFKKLKINSCNKEVAQHSSLAKCSINARLLDYMTKSVDLH